jgi:hypothetical protein
MLLGMLTSWQKGAIVTHSLLSTEAIQRERLGQIADAIQAVSSLSLAGGSIPADPSRALYGLAKRGEWSRLASTAEARKAALQVRTLAKLRDSTDRLEWSFAAADLVHTTRPFPARDPITRADIESKLTQAGKDPALAAAVFKRRSGVALAGPLETSSQSCGDMWTALLRRDAVFNLALVVGNYNIHRRSRSLPAQAVDFASFRDTVYREMRIAAKYSAWDLAQVGSSSVVAASSQLEAAIRYAASLPRPGTTDAAVASVDAVDTMVGLLSLIAALKTLTWRLMWPHVGGGTELQSALAQVKSRPESLPALAAAGDFLRRTKSSTRPVSIVGEVVEVSITHEARGKAVTRMTIRDFDSGDELPVEVNGFKADAGGAVEGVAVRLTGEWLKDAKGARLRVGREATAGNRHASTGSYLAWLSAAVYEPRPHGLMIHPAWLKKSPAPLNPIRYGVSYRKG